MPACITSRLHGPMHMGGQRGDERVWCHAAQRPGRAQLHHCSCACAYVVCCSLDAAACSWQLYRDTCSLPQRLEKGMSLAWRTQPVALFCYLAAVVFTCRQVFWPSGGQLGGLLRYDTLGVRHRLCFTPLPALCTSQSRVLRCGVSSLHDSCYRFADLSW